MHADWTTFATIAGPVLALFLGAALNHWLERRPRVIAYFTHATAFTIPSAAGAPPSQQPQATTAPAPQGGGQPPTTTPPAQGATTQSPMVVHTHGIVIRNVGRRSANDVRVRHHVLPVNFTVSPVVTHLVQDQPGGGAEIVIPTLVPGEQVTISYLYFPPLYSNQIHAGIRHSEGFAIPVDVLPRPPRPKALQALLYVLLALGLVTVIQIIVAATRLFWGWSLR